MRRFFAPLVVGLFVAAPALAQQPQAPAAAATSTHNGVVAAAKYYEGGSEALYAFLQQELKYPIMAKRNRIQGTCIVSFTLNPDGTKSGVKLVKQIGGGCGDEALRLVHLLKFQKPEYAILTNLPIAFKLSAPVPAATE